MLNERLAAARKVAAPLHQTKGAVRSTLLESARLTTAILEGSEEARIPIAMCADALHKIAQGDVAATEALVHYSDAHAKLATVRDKIGLSTRMAGDWWDSAEEASARQPETVLKAVS